MIRTTPMLVLTLMVFSTSLRAEETSPVWPGWRGPVRDGRVSGQPWPQDVANGKLAKVWSVDLEPSYSGPVVGPDDVFVTETVEGTHERVRALDRRTGRELWRTRWEGALTVPFFAAANGSWIRSTPFFDGKRLYVAGMRDVLVSLDARTGEENWRVDLAKRFGTPLQSFGLVSSPLVVDGHVNTQAGGSELYIRGLTRVTAWRWEDAS